MFYSRKNTEPVEHFPTDIWTCVGEECSCWMRQNYSFEDSPNCPICQSPMIKDTRMLPELSNISSR